MNRGSKFVANFAHSLLYVVAMLLWACGDPAKSKEVEVSGGGIETTNGGIVSAKIMQSDYSPAASATVQVAVNSYRGEPSQKDSILSVQANGQGLITLGLIPRRYTMLARKNEQAVLTRFDVLDKDSSYLELVLAPVETLFVRCEGDCAQSKFTLLGMPLSSELSLQNNAIAIADIPPGSYYLESENASSDGRTVNVVYAGDAQASIHVSKESALLLENFSDRNDQHLYGELTGGGWWFTASDAQTGGNSRVVPDCAGTGIQCAVREEQNNRYLQMDFMVDTTQEQKYALVGVDLMQGRYHPSNNSADLRAMDSITFKARGAGEVKVQLTVGNSIEEAALLCEIFQSHHTLLADWQTYTVHTGGLKALCPGVEWGKENHSVTSINFMFEEPGQLHLDDIYLHGVLIDDLLVYRPE
jgi:hypothetical protein